MDLQLISDGGLELTLQLRLVRFLESRGTYHVAWQEKIYYIYMP